MGGRKLLRRLAIGVFALVLIGDAGLLAAIWLTREPVPKPLTAERIFTASRPAVVLVQGDFDVKTSVPRPVVPKAKQDAIIQQLIGMVDSGRLADNEQALETAATNLIISHPDSYIQPGSDRLTDEFTLVSGGSGFFVTQDGYLVTAAHIVSPQKPDILAQILQIDNEPANIAQGEKDIRNSLQRDVGITPTDAQLQQLSSWYIGWEKKYATVDSVDPKYYLGLGTVLAGQSLTVTGVRANLVSEEPVPPGRDVAVMKADVGTVPALALATADPTAVAETYVVGYPREASLAEEPPSDSTVKVALSSGAVRDREAMDGWTAYRTDANVTHGNSGGPVLDRLGHVLGIVSFGKTDNQGNLLPGQGYFVPVSILRQVLQKASVKAAPGTLTSLYYQALSQGDFRHYRNELPLLTAVQAGSAQQVYVKDDILATQSAILVGRDQTPPKLSPYLPDAAGATGVAFLVLVMTLAWPRRKPPIGLPIQLVPEPGETLPAPDLGAEPALAGTPLAATGQTLQ